MPQGSLLQESEEDARVLWAEGCWGRKVASPSAHISPPLLLPTGCVSLWSSPGLTALGDHCDPSLELFPRPVLTARPSWSITGKSVTLICETQLPPQRSDVKLWFYFFQDGQELEVSSKNFLETSTTTMRGQKPQYYWCEARRGSSGVCKQSQKVKLHVPSECPCVLICQGLGAGKSQAELHVRLDCLVDQEPRHSCFEPCTAAQPTFRLTCFLPPPKPRPPAQSAPAA